MTAGSEGSAVNGAVAPELDAARDAGEELRLVNMLGQDGHGVVNGRRPVEFKRRRLHAWAAGRSAQCFSAAAWSALARGSPE